MKVKEIQIHIQNREGKSDDEEYKTVQIRAWEVGETGLCFHRPMTGLDRQAREGYNITQVRTGLVIPRQLYNFDQAMVVIEGLSTVHDWKEDIPEKGTVQNLRIWARIQLIIDRSMGEEDR